MKPIIAANWKMYKTPEETKNFFNQFLPELKNKNCEIIFFVPAINLTTTASAVSGTPVKFGAQNIYFEDEGAFTGETSPRALTQIGAQYALIGHSERRTLFHETDESVNLKVKAAQRNKLIPMICVGETLKEREQGITNQVITHQLRCALNNIDLTQEFIIAYEPVWAIGTGKVAAPQDANLAHKALRDCLGEISPQLKAKIKILYGGSVKPDNSKALFAEPEVDGFLIGGASLDPKNLLQIINYV